MARNKSWIQLDNAAKIFPPTSGKTDTKVFRFSCELNERVDKKNLQIALDRTLKNFPLYTSVLKRGLFWYYFEESDLRPVVKEENTPVCGPLYDKNVKTLLFEVSYFKNRINLEIFHAISDGTGTIEFLRELVCRYLSLMHSGEIGEYSPISLSVASMGETVEDSFQKYYDAKSKKLPKSPLAFKPRGSRIAENRIKVTEGILPLDRLLKIARDKGITLTVLLTCVLICSICSTMREKDKKKPVVISIPVNLRKYFSSSSLRNFFVVTGVSYSFGENPPDLDSISKLVSNQLRENLTPENLLSQMSRYISIEKNIAARIAPLFLKDISMRSAHSLSARHESAVISNLGAISVPEKYEKFINCFDVLSSSNRIQVCVNSYKNKMVISFTDPFEDNDIQRYFFRTLSDMGARAVIVASHVEK